jgi:hypothetical protein
MSRRLLVLGAITLASLVGAAFSAPALAKQRNRLKLTAPATNTAAEAFMIHFSGFVASPADLLTSYVSKRGCPTAFHPAAAVGNQPGSEELHPGKHGKRFSITIEPSETTLGLYHICAYLIHGHKTYARATGKSQTVVA